jgi:adenylate cyclase
MATTLRSKETTEREKQTLETLVFSDDISIYYIGLVKKDGAAIDIIDRSSSKALLEENGLTQQQIETIVQNSAADYDKAFSGETVVSNASPQFNQPVIGIAMPFELVTPAEAANVLVVYVPMKSLLEAVQSPGIIKSMVINWQGDVLAHHDSTLVKAKTNFINLPIVSTMLKSPGDNGLMRYADEQGQYYLGAFYRIGFSDLGVISIAPESKAFEAVYRIQKRNILFTIIVINIGILVVYLFSKTLTKPIGRLVAATREIEKGNYEVGISSTSSDEIGDLTTSFVHMGKGLAEREKMKDAFGKFVNKEIAEQVLKAS